jgi:hypothetical protein
VSPPHGRERRQAAPSGIGVSLAALFMILGAGMALGGGGCAVATGPWNGERVWAPQATLLGVVVLVSGLMLVRWAWRSR